MLRRWRSMPDTRVSLVNLAKNGNTAQLRQGNNHIDQSEISMLTLLTNQSWGQLAGRGDPSWSTQGHQRTRVRLFWCWRSTMVMRRVSGNQSNNQSSHSIYNSTNQMTNQSCDYNTDETKRYQLTNQAIQWPIKLKSVNDEVTNHLNIVMSQDVAE